MSTQLGPGLIYEMLFTGCAPCVFDGLWQRFASPAKRIRRPSLDSEKALRQLLAHFSAAELTQVGVMVNGSLNSALTDPKGMIVALRAEPGRPPYELLTSEGCVSRKSLAVTAVLGDPFFASGLDRTEGALCVAFSIADVAVLLSMGIPTTLATGLEEVSGRALDELCAQFGLKREYSTEISTSKQTPKKTSAQLNAQLNGNETQEAEQLPQLVFVNWSPATFSLAEPAGFRHVLAHVEKIQQYLEVNMNDVYSWRPVEAELKRLEFCLQHGRRSDIHQLFRGSLSSASMLLWSPPESEQPALPPRDYPSAWAAVVKADPSGKESHTKAWEEFEKALDHDLIALLVEQALAVPKPVERNLAVFTANLFRLLHTKAMRLNNLMGPNAKVSNGQPFARVDVSESFDRDFQQMLALADQVLALSHGLKTSWRRKRTSNEPHA